MGLGTYSARSTYLSIADGAVVRRYKSADEDLEAKPRTTKTGEIVYERKYPDITGFITDIQIGSSTFAGKTVEKAQWKVTIVDGDESFVVTMPYSSAYAKRLINSLASVTDFSKRLRLFPWKMENKEKPGKYWHGVTVYLPPFTKESKVLPAYSKDDIPPMREVRLKGETQWDDEEQMAFFENVVQTIILKRIEESRSTTAVNRIAQTNTGLRDEAGDAQEPPYADNDEGPESTGDFQNLPF